MNEEQTVTPIPDVKFAGAAFHSLPGRGVIVTGGAGGIGADIVRAFAEQGCRVGFVDRDASAGAALAAGLPALVRLGARVRGCVDRALRVASSAAARASRAPISSSSSPRRAT